MIRNGYKTVKQLHCWNIICLMLTKNVTFDIIRVVQANKSQYPRRIKMSFLPTDYQSPKTSNYYMKLQEGENRIRILSKPIFGWEDWHDNKPVRYAMDKKPAKAFDPKKQIRHFWAFVVFNYQEEQIQIMQVTQATIRKSLESLCRDTDWGSPYSYDIKIVKTGDGVDTEYTVNPVPHKKLDEYLIACFDDRRCNLNALFDNADPFSSEWSKDELTPRAIEGEDKVEASTPHQKGSKIVKMNDKPLITSKQAEELADILSQCPATYVESVHSFMNKQGISSYAALTPDICDKIMQRAVSEKEKMIKEQYENKSESPKNKDSENELF